VIDLVYGAKVYVVMHIQLISGQFTPVLVFFDKQDALTYCTKENKSNQLDVAGRLKTGASYLYVREVESARIQR
jgi:hypothetical protein